MPPANSSRVSCSISGCVRYIGETVGDTTGNADHVADLCEEAIKLSV
jgi:hypothetical protein